MTDDRTRAGGTDRSAVIPALAEPAQEPTDEHAHDVEAEGGRGRRFLRIGLIVQAAANVATAITVGLLLWQLWLNGIERERERSLELVRAWDEDGHADRFAEVNAVIEQRYRASGLEQMDDLTREERAHANANMGATLAAEGIARLTSEIPPTTLASVPASYLSDVDRLILFFERMEICLASELCNTAVLAAYFGETVPSAWQYFEGHVRVRRTNGYPTMGDRVPDLIERFAAVEDTL